MEHEYPYTCIHAHFPVALNDDVHKLAQNPIIRQTYEQASLSTGREVTDYRPLRATFAPAASNFFLMSSASALGAEALISLGAVARLHEIFSFFKAEACDFTNDLNDADLFICWRFIKHYLIIGRLSAAAAPPAAGAAATATAAACGFNAPFVSRAVLSSAISRTVNLLTILLRVVLFFTHGVTSL